MLLGLCVFCLCARADLTPAAPGLVASPTEIAIQPLSQTPNSKLDLNARQRPWINFRVNPQGLLYTVWGAALDLTLSDHLALGPALQFFNGSSARNDLEVYQYGISATVYLSGPIYGDAWYARLGVSALYISVTRFQNNDAYVGRYESVAPRVSAGRNWAIWRGLSAGAGLGFSMAAGRQTVDLRSSTGAVITRPVPVSLRPRPFVELNLAWAF